MVNDPYNSFKRGIKNDVRDAGLSVLLLGGVILLAIIVLTILFVVIKSKKMDDATRLMWGGGAVGFCILMLNANLRNLVLKTWVLLLIVIPTLVLFGGILYFVYQLCVQPL